MLSTTHRIVNHILLTVGLVLAMFAFPLSYAMLFKYGARIGETLHDWRVPAELNYFPAVALTIPPLLVGFWLWRSQWRFLKVEENISRNTASGFVIGVWLERIFCALGPFLAALSVPANLSALGLVVLQSLLVDVDTPLPTNLKLAVYTSLLIQVGLALCEFAIAFVVARSFWRLLQSTRASRTAEG